MRRQSKTGARLMLMLLASVVPGVATAQVATAIAPDLTAGTTVSSLGGAHTIDGGALAGPNLFHSFQQFDLGSGETAVWDRSAGTVGILRIINRVTGGTASHIYGQLNTTAFGDADFFFINPAGIVFGDGFSVDIPGAMHFSTASGLQFSDGATFWASASGASVLSVAPPQSFGFLGGESGDISFDFASPSAVFIGAGASSFSLSARDIELANVTLINRGAGIRAAALGGGAAALSTAGPLPSGLGGALTLGKASLLVDGNLASNGQAGPIDVSAGVILLENGFSSISSQTAFGNTGADPIILRAGVLTIESGHIGSGVQGSSYGADVLLYIDRNLNLAPAVFNAASISTSADNPPTTGSPGNIIIQGQADILMNGGFIQSQNFGLGAPGSITIAGRSLTMQNRSLITTFPFGSTGATGDIDIIVGQLRMLGGTPSASAAGAFSLGPTISAQTSSNTPGGNIRIRAEDIFMTSTPDVAGQSPHRNIIFGGIRTTGAATGGSVDIEATNSITLVNALIANQNDTRVSAVAVGDLSIRARTLTLEGESSISSTTNGSGQAGALRINVGALNMSSVGALGNGCGACIRSASDAAFQSNFLGQPIVHGAAGSVVINADTLIMTSTSLAAAHISTSAVGNAGSPGSLTLNVRNLLSVGAGSEISSDTGVQNAAAGPGAQLQINAGSAAIGEGARISTLTFGPQAAGALVMDVGGTLSLDAGQITSSSHASGSAGSVTIHAGAIILDDAAFIASRSANPSSGPAGSVTIGSISDEVEQIEVLNGSQISTSSLNANAAGPIHIFAHDILIDGANSQISSANSSNNGGAAGSVTIDVDPITISNGGQINTNSATGAAGNINILAPPTGYLLLIGASSPGVITTSSGPGTGGAISIANPLAVISNGGQILALGQAAGANVDIQSSYFIRSTDRTNVLSVDGVLVLDASADDVSGRSQAVDAEFLNAGDVLAGFCANQRSGVASVLRFESRATAALSPIFGPAFYSDFLAIQTQAALRGPARCTRDARPMAQVRW